MRTFFELLPYKFGQAVSWRSLRVNRTARCRRSTDKRGAFGGTGSTFPQASPPTNRSGIRRLFVDVAVISKHDAETGIQRVVRSLALNLREVARESKIQWDVCFVSASRKKNYHVVLWPSGFQPVVYSVMNAMPGDIFVGLDYSLDAVRTHRRQLKQFRESGGALWFLVHDLLPLNRPNWFSRNTVTRYRAWLDILACLADGFLCNSDQTEDELKGALAEVYGVRDGYRTQVLPMSHSISGERSSCVQTAVPLRFDDSPNFALMVGTLEPRKGHAEVIAAFEDLWRDGYPGRLVLVGRLGWQVDELRDLIRGHVQYGAKLFWFDDVDDVELLQIYQACTGVVVASHAEGFGLPLIEALGCGKPVLARDLPVFRTHEKRGVRFFPSDAGRGELAAALQHWMMAAGDGSIAVDRPTGDWREAAKVLLNAIAQTEFPAAGRAGASSQRRQ